MKLFKKEIMV